jgi:hypothetical protein
LQIWIMPSIVQIPGKHSHGLGRDVPDPNMSSHLGQEQPSMGLNRCKHCELCRLFRITPLKSPWRQKSGNYDLIDRRRNGRLPRLTPNSNGISSIYWISPPPKRDARRFDDHPFRTSSVLHWDFVFCKIILTVKIALFLSLSELSPSIPTTTRLISPVLKRDSSLGSENGIFK